MNLLTVLALLLLIYTTEGVTKQTDNLCNPPAPTLNSSSVYLQIHQSKSSIQFNVNLMYTVLDQQVCVSFEGNEALTITDESNGILYQLSFSVLEDGVTYQTNYTVNGVPYIANVSVEQEGSFTIRRGGGFLKVDLFSGQGQLFVVK